MSEKIPVLISGLGENGKGQMSLAVAQRIAASSEFELFPYGLTAEDTSAEGCLNTPVPDLDRALILFRPSERVKHQGLLVKEARGRPVIAVDFSTPDALMSNAEFFASMGFNSVIGTSGGDLEKLAKLANGSGTNITYAPNMAPAVVSVQYAIGEYAKRFPNCLGFCEAYCHESHQEAKGSKTSATAKEIMRLFGKELGARVMGEGINRIRDKDMQRRIGVPEKYLDGHGWHTYFLVARDEKGQEQIRDFGTFLSTTLMIRNPVVSEYFRENWPIVEPLNESQEPTLIPGKASFARDVFVGMNSYGPEEMRLAHHVNGRGPYVDGTFLAMKNQSKVPGLSTMVDIIYGRD